MWILVVVALVWLAPFLVMLALVTVLAPVQLLVMTLRRIAAGERHVRVRPAYVPAGPVAA